MAWLTPSVPANGRLRGNDQKSIQPLDRSPATRGASGAGIATNDHACGHNLESWSRSGRRNDRESSRAEPSSKHPAYSKLPSQTERAKLFLPDQMQVAG